MRALSFLRFVIPSLALGLAACGGGGTSESAGGAGASGGTGTIPTGGGGAISTGGSTTAPTTEGPYGAFDIEYDPGTKTVKPSTKISGIMRDGTPTESTLWEKKKTEGECSLYIPRAPFCESCVAPQVCVADNVCRTPPASYPVGAVTLTGLTSPSGANPLELILINSDVLTNYQCAETLPMPACTEGGAIRLDATGAGQFPAFSIAGQCIAPLVVSNPKISIESGKDFSLTWTPGAVTDARIGLTFNLSHHGGSKGKLICETADSGSLRVPGTLIKALIDLGVSGFPSADVKRVYTGKAAVGTGQAELRLTSSLAFEVEVPGITSCNTSADCTAPETCQSAIKMCGISCTSSADCPTGKTCNTTAKLCK